jgi:CDGSH-type Zn-finger protein
MCGCKLSKNAPFCDGQTCKMLADGNKFEAIQEVHEASETE